MLPATETEVIAALEAFGARFSPGGAHLSRTMMLDEVTRLLRVVPGAATLEEYRRAVMEENALGKGTASTRRNSYKHLRELYGLAADLPLFGIFRELVATDPASAPLLALLVSWSREPLLRTTTSAMLSAVPGCEVSREELAAGLLQIYPGRYSTASAATITRNVASTWTQSGHLAGRIRKVRCQVQPRPAAVTLALILGHVARAHGERLFGSPWCRLLDLDAGKSRALAVQAHREGLLDLRAIDTVVEIRFPRFARILGDSG